MHLGKFDSANSTDFFKVVRTNQILFGILVIVLGTLAAYWPAFSAGFIWDDDAYVTNNPLLTESHGLSKIWFSAYFQSQYFPLVYTTLRLEHALWGFNPVGYHVVNVVLHIANALLIWALLKRLALPGAWLAAAIFALHPVQVETVAWVTELKNTESTLFYLLALFAWMNFCGGKNRWFYALALALQALALFAKTTACTLPAVMLLVLWLKHEPVNRKRIFQVLPFFVLGVAMGLVSVWWERHLGNYQSKFHLLGGPLDRLLIATRALWFYAGKIFWPTNLTFSYPHWEINANDWRQYIWLAGCLIVAALLWVWRHRLGRGPTAAILFFVAVLSPLLGFIPLYTFYYSYVADHYQYLACLGLIALFAATALRLSQRWQATLALQCGLATALLLVLGILTWRQCHVYRNLETLWDDTLKKNPQSWMAHTNLGRLLAQQGDFQEAERHYQDALQINPDDEGNHYNYGILLAREGRLAEAETQYREALELAPGKAIIHNNLGTVLLRQKRFAEAIAQFQQAIRCAATQPDFYYNFGGALIHNNLGIALSQQKRFAEAVAQFQQAIHYDSAQPDFYYNLGGALAAEHKTNEAAMEYRHVLQLNPNFEPAKKRLQALGAPPN